MSVIFEGEGPIFEAANAAYAVLFEGHGLVSNTIKRTRDSIVSRGIPKDTANDIVLKTRQMFFDPFAAPGVKPVTDPTFKKMLPIFGHLAHMMVDTFHYGTPRYNREAAEDFAARFVEYAKENFQAGPPNLTVPEFEELASKISNGKSKFAPERGYYDYIQVHSWEELKKLSAQYHMDSWCNVRSEEDWDRYSLYGHGKFYLLVSDDADKVYGKREVIGVTINHYGKLVYAFDRENDCVDKAALTPILDKMGLTEPFATDFSTGIDLVKAGYDAETVFPYCKSLHGSLALVGFDDRTDMCILDETHKSYISDVFTSIEEVRGSDHLYVIDDSKLFDTDQEAVIVDTWKLPGNLVLDADHGAIDEADTLMPLRSTEIKRYGTCVNAVCITDRKNGLLLDKDNTTPFLSAEFRTSTTVTNRNILGDTYTKAKWPTVEDMDGNDFWVVAAKDGQYIVDVPGKKLEDYKFIPDIPGLAITVLSPNGYYSARESVYNGEDRYYLMKDGKKVFECPFCDVGSNSSDSYIIYMVTMDKKNGYLFDPVTGKISEQEA